MNKTTAAAVAAGTALRLAGLFTASIWYDESYTVAIARLPWLKLVQVAGLDFNPPLWELLVKLAGANLTSARLLAWLFSILTLALLAALLPELPISPTAAALALWLAALLPYQLWVGQDARVYALMALLYLLAFYFAWRGRMPGFAAALGLLCWSHNAGAFYAAGAVLAALALQPGRRGEVIRAAALAALSFLPWLPAYMHSAGVSFWLPPLSASWLFASLAFILYAGTVSMWPSAAAAFLTVTAAAFAIANTSRARLALLLWALVPLVGMIAVSLVKPVIFYRPMTAALVPLLVWLAACLLPGRGEAPQVAVWMLGVVAALGLAGLAWWSPQTRGAYLDQAAAFVAYAWRPGDVVYHATATTWLPWSFLPGQGASYLMDGDQQPALLQTAIRDALAIPRAPLEAIPHRRAWVVWARDPLLSGSEILRLVEYTRGGTLVARLTAWQFAPIEIYIVETSK